MKSLLLRWITLPEIVTEHLVVYYCLLCVMFPFSSAIQYIKLFSPSLSQYTVGVYPKKIFFRLKLPNWNCVIINNCVSVMLLWASYFSVLDMVTECLLCFGCFFFVSFCSRLLFAFDGFSHVNSIRIIFNSLAHSYTMNEHEYFVSIAQTFGFFFVIQQQPMLKSTWKEFTREE